MLRRSFPCRLFCPSLASLGRPQKPISEASPANEVIWPGVWTPAAPAVFYPSTGFPLFFPSSRPSSLINLSHDRPRPRVVPRLQSTAPATTEQALVCKHSGSAKDWALKRAWFPSTSPVGAPVAPWSAWRPRQLGDFGRCLRGVVGFPAPGKGRGGARDSYTLGD